MAGRNKIEIEISRRITVDSCIAQEIGELNNIHGINTLTCCCGHGIPNQAFIKVFGGDAQKMKALGYEKQPVMFIGKQKVISENAVFIPKSQCRCRNAPGYSHYL